MKLLVTLLISLIPCFMGKTFHDVLSTEWESYKAEYGKVYSPTEDAERFEVWKEQRNIINSHNEQFDMGLHTYSLGMNQFADWTDPEYQSILGFRADVRSQAQEAATFLPPSNVQLPRKVDWREKGYVTPIKNQGACGSCWAFSATGALEGQHFRKTRKLVSLSEQNLVDCVRQDHGCHGGLPSHAFLYIKENRGIDTEESYPYKAIQGRCRFDPENVGATDKGFVATQPENETDLQIAVATQGPISVGIDAALASFRYYKEGVYSDPQCSSSPRYLDHGVLAVGYGTTEDGQDYWIVKNSWGTTWGDEGYIKIARNQGNLCGIADMPTYPLV